MAVALDAVVAADTTGAGVTSVTLTPNLTVGVGSNRALTASLALNKTGVTGGAINWDQAGTPVALTQISTISSGTANIRTDMFAMVNPVSGAKNLVASWTGNSDVCLAAACWTGVDQTGGTTSFPHGNTGSGACTGSPQTTVTITSATGNMTMSGMSTTGTPTACAQTQIYSDATPATMSAGAARAAGAASVAFGWTIVGASVYVEAGLDIQAAGGGATATAIRQQYRPFPFMPGSAPNIF